MVSGIFIEELESNQHPESLKKIIQYLVNISKNNGLQFFITTHSPTIVWRTFEKEFSTEEERERYFRCYLVKRDTKDGTVQCLQQTKDNADQFFNEVDMEMYGEKRRIP